MGRSDDDGTHGGRESGIAADWLDELHFRILGRDDIPDVFNLQNYCIDQLAPENRSFVLPKTFDRLTTYATSLGRIVGAFYQQTLIASAIVVFPESKADSQEMRILSPYFRSREAAVLKAAYVHPAYRGFAVHKTLLSFRINLARRAERRHIITEIAVRNTASVKGYLELGSKVKAIRYDPDDGTPLYYLYMPLRRSGFKDSLEFLTCHPVHDLTFQEDLIRQGFLGIKMIDQETILYQRLVTDPDYLALLNSEGHPDD